MQGDKKSKEKEGIEIEKEENKEQLARVPPEATKREAIASLTTLSTLVKQKCKRRQAPLYFRTRKSTRIKQGKPQISTKTPIEIEDSPTQRDKMTSPKSPITYIRRPSTRSNSLKGKSILQDPQKNLQEVKTILQNPLKKLQEA